MLIVNIAAYKFIEVPRPSTWRDALKTRCEELGVMGSIVLAPEGINLFMAGARSSIDSFLNFLRHDKLFERRFENIEVKESLSEHQPFRRIVVRLKKEIITMKHPMICPGDERAPGIDPQTLKKWLDQGHDDNGRELVLLDTRNNFEIDIGTFEGSLNVGIDSFSEFPQKFLGTASNGTVDLQGKTIVSFCTGGIRCEKAALFLRDVKFENVFQLNGGILRYFEEVGGAHWNGECFVFDRRVALDPDLQTTKQHYEVTAPPERNAMYQEWEERQKSR